MKTVQVMLAEADQHYGEQDQNAHDVLLSDAAYRAIYPDTLTC